MTESDRIALVTGANQGIGLEIARQLAAEGLTVLLGSRNHDKGVAAAATLNGKVHPIQLDVTDQASIEAAAAKIDDQFGRLDVLVNNAAISHTMMKPGQTLEDYRLASRASRIPVSEVRAVWETNVFGVIALSQALLPLLRRSTAGHIVNVSSGLGSLAMNATPHPYRATFNPGYGASKSALNAITLAFAIDLEAEGIRVNAVTPGFTKTNLNNYEGTETVEQGAAEAVRVALLGADAPTGTFTEAGGVAVPW